MAVRRNASHFLVTVLCSVTLSRVLATVPYSQQHHRSYDTKGGFYPAALNNRNYKSRISDSFDHEVSASYHEPPHFEENGVQGYLYYYLPAQYNQEHKKANNYEYSSSLFYGLFVLPLAALVGISFAIPAGFSVAAGRDFDYKEIPFVKNVNDALSRMEQVYYAATGSEECLRKIVCDLGAINKNIGTNYKNIITSLFDRFTPTNYDQFSRDFQKGLLNEKCSQFVCDGSVNNEI